MLKRASARRPSLASLDDDDDDAISITSTQESVHSDGHAFGVDRVLAEERIQGRKRYLILWEGYSEDRATWEPSNNIIDKAILAIWRKRKEKEKRGIESRFDVKGWATNVERLFEEKADRRRRRRAKRRRKGMPVSDTEPENNTESEENDESGTEPEDDVESITEVHDVVENDVGLTKAAAPTTASQKPVKVLVTGANVRLLTDSSSDVESPENGRPKNKDQHGFIHTFDDPPSQGKNNVNQVGSSPVK